MNNTAVAFASTAFVVGLAVGIVAVVAMANVRAEGWRRDERTLEARFNELSISMRDSARLVEALSAELDARKLAVRQLEEKATTAEAVAELNKEQADAVQRILEAQLATSERRIRGDSIKIGIGSFVAGGGVSFLVTLLVHPLQ